MKKFIKYYTFGLSCIITFLLISACYSENEIKKYDDMYGGKYELRKFNVRTSTENTSSAFFFMFIGGYTSNTTEVTHVRYYFKNYKGDYEFGNTHLNMINIRIDNTITQPYLTYDYHLDGFFTIDKVILHCRDSDFIPEININNLK